MMFELKFTRKENTAMKMNLLNCESQYQQKEM